jgi:hypothetical protein
MRIVPYPTIKYDPRRCEQSRIASAIIAEHAGPFTEGEIGVTTMSHCGDSPFRQMRMKTALALVELVSLLKIPNFERQCRLAVDLKRKYP